MKVWLELRSRYNAGNNDKLSLSLEEGAKLLGMSKTTVGRASEELEEAGFIVKARQGQWYGRLATEWRVTDQPCNGHPPTRDWQSRQPPPASKNKTRYRDGPYCTGDGPA